MAHVAWSLDGHSVQDGQIKYVILCKPIGRQDHVIVVANNMHYLWFVITSILIETARVSDKHVASIFYLKMEGADCRRYVAKFIFGRVQLKCDGTR